MEQKPDIDYIGKYRVNRILGYGSMGTVYECQDPQFERVVAVKILHSHLLDSVKSDEYLQRFKNEIIATGSFSHPNIVTIFDADFTARPPYLVMEYVNGVELSELIKGEEDIEYADIFCILTDILRGLDEIHHVGVIHRDLKPSNIFITKTRVAKIADFGVARIEGSELTQMGDILGSPKYMSPEQCMGNPLDQRSDIFTVGSIFFELLTRQSCFSGNSSTAVVHNILNGNPPTPSQVSPRFKPFDKIINKALAKDPAKRFQTAKEFIAEVEVLRDDILFANTVKMYQGTKKLTFTSKWGFSRAGKMLVAGSGVVFAAAMIGLFLLDSANTLQVVAPQDKSGELASDATAELASDTAEQDGDAASFRSELVNNEELFHLPTEAAGAGISTLSGAPVSKSTQINLSRVEKIGRLLNIAETYISVERLIAPRGTNALEAYRAVLSIEPKNPEALKGVSEIKEMVVWQIEDDISQENIGFAKKTLFLAKATFPNDSSWSYFDVKLGLNSTTDN